MFCSVGKETRGTEKGPSKVWLHKRVREIHNWVSWQGIPRLTSTRGCVRQGDNGHLEGMTPPITAETSLSHVLTGSFPAMPECLRKGKLLPKGSISFANSLLLSLVTPDFVFLLKEDSMHSSTIKPLFSYPAILVTITNSKRLVHIGMPGNTAPMASLVVRYRRKVLQSVWKMLDTSLVL